MELAKYSFTCARYFIAFFLIKRGMEEVTRKILEMEQDTLKDDGDQGAI